MDAVGSLLQARTAQVSNEIGARLLRTNLDQQQEQAVRLLDVLPQAGAVDPGRGARIDLYA